MHFGNRGSGFLRRVASGRYIAVVEERQMEQFANRGYDVLDKIRALDPSVNLSLSIGIGRGAKTLREGLLRAGRPQAAP